MKLVSFIIAFLIANFGLGQVFNTSNNWSQHKQEIYFGIGPTQFLGDLGGMDRVGSQNSLMDMNFSSTRMGGGFGYRYRFHPSLATTSQLYFGMVSGSDANTNEVIRRSRNLSFRSPILELSQRLEVILYANEQQKRVVRGVGGRPRADVIYVFGGISGFYFNPQTKIDGEWVDLKPLRTEGQGFEGGAEEYGRISMGIPMGIGFKMALNNVWRIGLEATYVKTFTDYIDDVSTDYYDPAILKQKIGSEAVYAANPAIENHHWFATGMQRGNPDDKDAYFYLNITITKNLKAQRGRLSSVKWGRTKF